MMMSIIVLYLLLTAPRHSQIFSAAKDREQASFIFEMVKTWIEESPELSARFKILRGKKLIINNATKSVYKPLSADAGSANGLNPYAIVVDELHVWEADTTHKRARAFWSALTTGGMAQADPKLFIITTAGENKDNSLLGDLYKKGVRIVTGEEEDNSFGFWCWEAEEYDDPLDPETWKKANPNLAEGLLNLRSYEKEVKEKAVTGFHSFLRMYLNLWVSVFGEPYIESIFWHEAIAPTGTDIPEGAEIVVGFDGSQTSDSTGIVIMDIATGVFKVWQAWEKPVNAGKEWFVNREDVELSMKKLHETYKVKLVWADQTYFTPDLLRWANQYDWEVTAIPQTRSRMVPMGQEWKKDLTDKNIMHLDEPVLNKHVKNAFLTQDGGYIKDRKGSMNKIDLLVASVLANGARRHVLSKETGVFFWTPQKR